jgi:hypothetical protein
MDDLVFKVERWTHSGQQIESILAKASNVLIAHGAFDAAKREYPNARLTLRFGIQVVAEHPERERS